MAVTVTGTIGNEAVSLNNAASEATLLKLLQAVQASAGATAASNTAALAKQAGVDAKTADQTTQLLTKLGFSTGPVTSGFVNLFNQVKTGAPSISGAMAGFTELGGKAGTLALVLSMAAEYQEKNLEVYRAISKSGANFGGSLTDLRLAAANAYVTLDQFGSIIAKNSQTLATLGGSVNGGAIAFAKLSNNLISSQLGSNLMALGYTAEDVNNGMLDYIAITGGRTKEELRDTKSITAGTAQYLEQLDRLADVTGKSRDELAKQFKQQQETADMELYKASLSVADREKFTAVYDDALAKYGKGAADNVLAAAQGRAVTTEAGKKYAALAPMATKSLQDQLAATRQYGINSAQARESENQARVNNSKEFMRFSGTLGSATDILKGNEAAASQAAKDRITGLDNLKALDQAEIDRANNKKAQEASQAAIMSDAEKSLKELGQAAIGVINPIVQGLTPAFKLIGPIARVLGDVLTGLGKTIGVVMEPVGAVINGIVYVLDGAINSIAYVLENLKAPFVGLGNVISSLFNAISETLSSLDPSTWFSSKDKEKKKPRLAEGGIVNRATSLIAGEAGPEAIMPLNKLNSIIQNTIVTNNIDKVGKQLADSQPKTTNVPEKSDKSLELFNTKLDMLNNTTKELLKFMKDTAENTKRTHDATKALNGNLFAV